MMPVAGKGSEDCLPSSYHRRLSLQLLLSGSMVTQIRISFQ